MLLNLCCKIENVNLKHIINILYWGNYLMRKLPKILFLVFSTVFILTSCNNGNSQVNPTPVPSGGNAETTPVPEVQASMDPSLYAKDMDELMTSPRTLKINKKGSDTFYNAEETVTIAVTDILIKSRPLLKDYPEDAELIESYDNKNYDYILQYNNVKDIYLSLQSNLISFEGGEKIYQLWGDSKEFWDGLKYDDEKGSVGFSQDTGEYKLMSYQYKHDLNGDGNDENIELVYKRKMDKEFRGNLYLKVNNSEALIYDDMLWQFYPVNSLMSPPILSFLPQSSGKDKIIIPTIAWSTNEMGVTTTVYAFAYTNGSLQKLNFNAPLIEFSYDRGDTYKAIFPQLNETIEVKFDSEEYEKKLNEGKTLKEVIESQATFVNHPLEFLIKDYDGDGTLEICSMSALLYEDPIMTSLGILYTVYECSNNTLVPSKAFISPPYNQKEKESQVSSYLYNKIFYNGHLLLDDKENLWNKDTDEFKKEDIQPVLDELISNKYFVVKDKKIYLNN